MTLRDDVRTTLLHTGVGEGDNGDLSVTFGNECTWVRTFDDPPTVTVYRQIGGAIPHSAALDEVLQDHNRCALLFRAFWSEDAVFLRADVSAQPFTASHLQQVLDVFDTLAGDLARELAPFATSDVSVSSEFSVGEEEDEEDDDDPPSFDFPSAPEASDHHRSRRASRATPPPSLPRGPDSMKSLAFSLTVTVDGETQSVALGTHEVQAMIEMLPGDNPAFAGMFAAAASHPAATVRMSAAGKACLPADSVLQLATDPAVSVRRAVLASPFFRRLASDDLVIRMIKADPDIAVIVAGMLEQFEMANADVLGDAIATHPDPNVRLRAASAASTPKRLLNLLCQDPSADVARAARKNLAAWF